MKFSITLDGGEHTVEINQGNSLSCRIDVVVFDAAVSLVRPGVYSLLVKGKSFLVRVSPAAATAGTGSENGSYHVQIDGAHYAAAVRDPRRWSRAGSGLVSEGAQRIAAPMPGKVVRVLVAEQQAVEAGQGLVVVEARCRTRSSLPAREPYRR